MKSCAFALLCMVAAARDRRCRDAAPWPPPPWADGPPARCHATRPPDPGRRPAGRFRCRRPRCSQDLDEEQFITHWVYTYDVMAGGIDVDLIGEGSFAGAVLDGPISGAPDASCDQPQLLGSARPSTPATGRRGTRRTAPTSRPTAASTSTPGFGADHPAGAGDPRRRRLLQAVDQPHPGDVAHQRRPCHLRVDQYQQTATLNQGWNLILFKHSFPQLGPPDDPNPDNLYKYFSLRFTTPGGAPVHPVAAFDPMCAYTGQKARYTRVIVPSIAHLPGSGGSQWRTDTLLVNGTHMIWNYELNYFREGNASGAPNAVARIDIAPYAHRSTSRTRCATTACSASPATRRATSTSGDSSATISRTPAGCRTRCTTRLRPAASACRSRSATSGTGPPTRPSSTGCATAPTAPTSASCPGTTRARRRGCA